MLIEATLSLKTDDPWVLGYGTLVSAASLEGSIGDGAAASKRFHPVTVRGYRRSFNVRPDHYESSRILSAEGIERGAMNVQPHEGASFNGVIFQVTEEELASLDERERYYDRVSVPVLDFEDHRPLGDAFVYSASEGSAWVVDDPALLMPRWHDIALARPGFYRWSPEFGQVFDATTYLADGATPVAEHYGDLEAFRELRSGAEGPKSRDEAS